MFFTQQNTLSVYEILDDAHRAARLSAPYYDAMAQLFDDRYFTPPFMPWLKDFPPLLRARRLQSMRYKMLHRYTRAYEKPAFGIETVEVDGMPRHVGDFRPAAARNLPAPEPTSGQGEQWRMTSRW